MPAIRALWQTKNGIGKENIDDLPPSVPSRFVRMHDRALTEALRGGHCEVGEFLLTECQSALFVPASDFMANPMSVAIANGHIECVKLLLRHGWTPSIEDIIVAKGSRGLLEIAATNRQLEILRLLLEGEGNTAETIKSADDTPISSGRFKGLWASLLGIGDYNTNTNDTNASAKILNQADDNAASVLTNRIMLLTCAMETPFNHAVVDYLLDEVGISINIGSNVHETPLRKALRSHNTIMLGYLSRRLDQLHWSEERFDDNSTVLHELIKIPYYRDGSLPLTSLWGTNGSAKAHPDEYTILEAFLQHGADPNVADSHGTTPLHLTMRPHTINLLLDAGADVMAVDAQGSSVIHRQQPEVSTVRWVLAAGVKAKVAAGGQDLVELRDRNGLTALLSFAITDILEVYETLLGSSNEGSNKSCRLVPQEMDHHQRTVLHYAAMANVEAAPPIPPALAHIAAPKRSLVDFLISSKRCLPTDVDDFGQTALHSASAFAAKKLILNGWSVNVKNASGWAPLHKMLDIHQRRATFSSQISTNDVIRLLEVSSGVPSYLLSLDRSIAALTRITPSDMYDTFRRCEPTEEDLGPRVVPFESTLADPKGRTFAHILIDGLLEPAHMLTERVLTLLALIEIRKICIPCWHDNASVSNDGHSFTAIKDGNGRTILDIAKTKNFVGFGNVVELMVAAITDYLEKVKAYVHEGR